MNLAFKQAKQVAVLVFYQGALFFCLSPCRGDGEPFHAGFSC